MVRLRRPRSLGFRFAPPCEPGGHPQVWMLPLSRYGRVSASWFSSPGPWYLWRWVLTGFQRSQDAFHRLLSPHGSHSFTKPATRFFRRCPGACSGLRATPETSRPNQSPLVISPGPSASLLSAGDFPRERLSNPVVRLSPHGSQDPRGPCNASRPALPAAC